MRTFYKRSLIVVVILGICLITCIGKSQRKLSEEWLTLMHYGEDGKSFVEDPSFFIDPQGSAQPEREYLAQVTGFSNPVRSQELACKFPARYIFFKNSLSSISQTSLENICPQVHKKIKQLINRDVYLAFAVNNASSPLSAYGHLFLVFTDPKLGQDDLFAPSLSFAANDIHSLDLAGATSAVLTSIPGKYEVRPFFDKLHEYNNKENRDIWMIALKMTSKQKMTLLLHYLELYPLHLEYNFGWKNCSHYMLLLFEAALKKNILIKQLTPLTPFRAVQIIQGNTKGHFVKIQLGFKEQLLRLYSEMSSEERNILMAIFDSETNLKIAVPSKINQRITKATNLMASLLAQQDPQKYTSIWLKRRMDIISRALPGKTELNISTEVISDHKLQKIGADGTQFNLGYAFDKNGKGVSMSAFLADADDLRNSLRTGPYSRFRLLSTTLLERQNKWRFGEVLLMDSEILKPFSRIFQDLSWSIKLGSMSSQNYLHNLFLLGTEAGLGISFGNKPFMGYFFTKTAGGYQYSVFSNEPSVWGVRLNPSAGIVWTYSNIIGSRIEVGSYFGTLYSNSFYIASKQILNLTHGVSFDIHAASRIYPQVNFSTVLSASLTL